MKGKSALLFLTVLMALVLCGVVSAADNSIVNNTTSTYTTSDSGTSNEITPQDCLPTVAHDTINGEVYISSIANWPSKNTTNNFDVPNGTVVYAKYYVGAWMPGSVSSTFNGNAIDIEATYQSGMGVTWVSYDVTGLVVAGQTNTGNSVSSGGDDRQYGSTLIVVLKNESDPYIEYWITEGLDWLEGTGASSTTTLAGTVDLSVVQTASLHSIILTGYNSETLNGNTLPSATEHVGGSYFDAIRWDNIQSLLVPENQSVYVEGDGFTSLVSHVLTIEYQIYDLVPVNLTPNIVTPNTSNTMTISIENRGSTDSPAFNVSLLVDGTVMDTQTVTSLAGGNSTNVDFQWTPDGTKYSYNLTVSVDPDDVVHEVNEANNILDALVGTTTAPTPVADFTATPTTDDAPLTVNFTDESSNSPITWAWDFDNNGETDSKEQNPTYTYETAGTYTVKLTVTNAGGSDDEVKTDYITVNIPVTPEANFTATPLNGDVPLTVQFTDTSTNNPRTWAWDFDNNGETDSEEQNPTYTYETAGTYTVKLTVGNAAGSNNETKTDYINVSAITPIAAFTTSTAAGIYPLTVQFNDTSLNDPISWAWDFGDGTSSTEQNPTHTYTTVGNYTVKLTVTNLNGSDEEVQTNCVRVTSSTAPIADFAATPTTGDSPLTVQFTDQSTSSGSSDRITRRSGSLYLGYDPSFYGNDSTSFSQTVDLTGVNSLTFSYKSGYYTEGGGNVFYQVYLGNDVIWQTSDSTDWKPMTIDISSYTGLQTLKFTLRVTDYGGPADLWFNIKDISAVGTNSTTSWLWDFGDGTSSTEQNPTHTYNTTGAYTVNLTVTSLVGSDSEEKTDYITLNGPDLIVTSISPNVGAGDYMFANEPNTFTITVTNNGTLPSNATTMEVTINGTSQTVDVPALDAGASTTVTVTDPTGYTGGSSVPVSATPDPSNNIPETNEANNIFQTTMTVYNNGYKGKQYTDDDSVDYIDTSATFTGNVDIIYSTGSSGYLSGSSWSDPYTTTWTNTDLTIPTNSNLLQVRLYLPYTWSYVTGLPDFTATFNENTLNYMGYYSDTKGYGTSNYPSGLVIYDVTNLFNIAGNNLTLAKGSDTVSLYGAYLMVIYENAASTYKTIYINDGCDMLCSKETYSTNNTEATAYATYNNVSTTNLENATAIAILASAGDNGKSKFFFNNDEYTGFWEDYIGSPGPQTGFSTYDVTNSLQDGNNLAGIQSYNNGTNGDNMLALGTILILTKNATPADLQVSDLNTTENANLSETNTINATITNLGETGATNFTVRLYEDGVSVGKQIISLASGNSAVVNFLWKATTTGTHYLQIIADPANSITESNEGNNQQLSVVNVADVRPDLATSNLTTPSSPLAGTSYPVTVDVANNGASDATFTVRLYEDGISVGKQVITLTAGSSTTLSFTWTPNTTGSHDLMVWADPTGSITELSKTNNQQTTSVVVSDVRPDIEISNLVTPESPALSTSYPVTVDVANNGTNDATFTVRLYEDGVSVGKQVITLTAGSNTTLSFTWTPTTTGSHDLMVWADPTGSVDEVSESNNQLTTSLSVTDLRPDLEVTNLTVPSNPTLNTTYPVVADITNNGATSATFTVRFYEDGVCVGKQVINLDAGSTTPVLFAWTPTTSGSHELMIWADPANSIIETDETNNQQVATVSVT